MVWIFYERNYGSMAVTEDEVIKYDDFLESAMARCSHLLASRYGVSRRTIGLLLLQGDPHLARQDRNRRDDTDGERTN